MKGSILVAAALAAGTAFSAATPADKAAKAARDARLNEIAKALQKVSVDFNNWNNYYHDYYVNGISDEARAKILADNIALQKERIALAPENPGFRSALGDVYHAVGRYPEALAEFDAALANEKGLDGWKRASTRFQRAECLYAAGDEEGCRKALEELVALKISTVRRGAFNWSGMAATALKLLKGMNQDELKFPRQADAKAYPEPKKATYTEDFASVKELTVKLDGVAKDDARVKLLETKLTRFGAKVEYAGLLGLFSSPAYELTIALDDEAPVAEKEGYELVIGAKKATVRARDPQGVLWGVVSFIQCVDQEKCAVRQCSMLDWPDAAARGYLCRPSLDHLEFAIFNKINSVDNQDDAPCSWNHFSPLMKMWARRQAQDFRKYGIDFYYGIASTSMYPHMPLCEERTFRKHLEICKFYADCGAGVYFPFDDGRYGGGDKKTGLHPKDAAKYGCGAKVDAEYVSRLYREVKKDYPDFKLIFCPPFYWGPDSKAHYPEDRETYLRSLGEFLDPEIPAYWTGPMVKGYDKTREQVKWWVDLTKHKPAIFQNGCGAHNLINYGVDPTPWDVWHYRGFTKDIGPFHQNSNGLSEGAQIATLADYLWNEEGYDAKRSVRGACDRLVGKGVYDILAPALPSLAYFDKYKYGDLNVEVVNEKIDDLEAKLAVATNAWAKAVKLSPMANYVLGGFGRGCGWAAAAVKGAHHPPDFLSRYKQDILATEELAKKEVGFDRSKGDILFTAVGLSGGELMKHTDPALPKEKYGRLTKCLRGAQTSRSTVSGRFECDPFPPAGPYELILVMNDDERAGTNDILVRVNGKEIYRGSSDAPRTDYGIKKIEIPFETMVRYNGFSVQNLTDGTNPNGTPWLVVNYAVIRKKGK